MRRFRLHKAVALLIVGSGCSPGDVPSVSEPTPEIETIPAEAVHELGTSEAISRIADIAVGEDGTWWILNTVEPYLIAMAADGSVRRTWGKQGGGPSEFRNPNVLVTETESGHVWVYDSGHHALMRVDGPDDPVESIMIPPDSIPRNRIASTESAGTGGRAWIHGTDAGFLIAVGREGSTDYRRLWSANLILLNNDGSTEVRYAVARRLGDPATRFGEEATEFMPYPLWALCPDGAVAFYNPLDNAVHRLSREDTLVDSNALPPERGLEVTVDRAFRMAYGFVRDQAPGGLRLDSAAVHNQIKLMWNEIRAQAAEVFPEYADIQCPNEATLWLQPFDPDAGMMGRGPVWLRIGTDGSRQWFRFPETFQPLRFESDRVLGSHRGEFDIESVAWVTLPGT